MSRVYCICVTWTVLHLPIYKSCSYFPELLLHLPPLNLPFTNIFFLPFKWWQFRTQSPLKPFFSVVKSHVSHFLWHSGIVINHRVPEKTRIIGNIPQHLKPILGWRDVTSALVHRGSTMKGVNFYSCCLNFKSFIRKVLQYNDQLLYSRVRKETEVLACWLLLQ